MTLYFDVDMILSLSKASCQTSLLWCAVHSGYCLWHLKGTLSGSRQPRCQWVVQKIQKGKSNYSKITDLLLYCKIKLRLHRAAFGQTSASTPEVTFLHVPPPSLRRRHTPKLSVWLCLLTRHFVREWHMLPVSVSSTIAVTSPPKTFLVYDCFWLICAAVFRGTHKVLSV